MRGASADDARNTGTQDRELLKSAQALMQVERSLTAALEAAEPWLPSCASANNDATRGPQVRPLPTNMEEVHNILSVARHLAARTSAPSGWNPQAPLTGFSTPNPLPHQLRGGALGTLQLQRAKEQLQLEEERKRKRQEEENQAAAASKRKERQSTAAVATQGVDDSKDKSRDPKRNEVVDYEKQLARPEEDLASSIHMRQREGQARQAAQKLMSQQQQHQQQRERLVNADMNLSDSSSSEEEDD